MAQTPIRVVLADDHTLYRDGLRLLLKKQKHIEVVGEADNWKALIEMANSLLPDVVLTDVQMPGVVDLNSIQAIAKLRPGIEVVVLSVLYDETTILETLAVGALGFVTKNADNIEILDAIESAFKHEPYYCSVIAGKLVKRLNKPRKNVIKAAIPLFSGRELSIIKYICEQFSSKEISEKMYLNFKTVEWHRNNIMEKMQVKNVAGIVVYAIKHGLYIIEQPCSFGDRNTE